MPFGIQLALLVLAVFVVLGLLYFVAGTLRKRAWIRLAQHAEFRYFDENGVGPDGRQATDKETQAIKAFTSPALQGGYHQHVLWRSDSNGQQMICDYVSYRTTRQAGEPENTRSSTTTVLAVQARGLDLPDFRICWNSPEASTRAGSPGALPPIEPHVTNLPRGVTAFGNDVTTMTKLLSPPIVEGLRSSPPCVLEGSGDRFYLYGERKLRMFAVEQMLDVVNSILNHLGRST